MLRIALIWGVLAGIIMSAPFYLFMGSVEDFDPDSGMIIGFATMIIAFGTSYFGVKAYRAQRDSWSFGRAWGSAALIAFVGMIIYVAAWMGYNSANPEFMENMFTNQVESIQNDSSLSEDQKTAQLEEAEWYREVYETNVGIALITFTEPLIPAIVVSLIIGLLLKKAPEKMNPLRE